MVAGVLSLHSPLVCSTRMNDLLLPWWLPSQKTIDEREKILAGKFFLVRIAGNDSFGDPMVCVGADGVSGCGKKHKYLTLRCIEQPFSGLTGGLYAYWKTVGDTGASELLSPAQKSRYDAISRLFGPQPDLATSHPRTSQLLGTGPRDIDAGALALGVLEPISRAKAIEYARAINMRGIKPPFTLPGVQL